MTSERESPRAVQPAGEGEGHTGNPHGSFQSSAGPPSAQRIAEALACGRQGCPCAIAARRGTGTTHCAAHEDRSPSLSIREGGGKPLFHCQAGCSQAAVLEALGERGLWGSTPSRDGHRPTPVHRHEVRDECGDLAAVHCRQDRPEGKRMWWELPDGTKGLAGRAEETLPLYGSERLAGLPDGAAVIVTEGEKATDALLAVGVAAVGTVTGAKATPNADALRPLARLRPYLWPDNDPPGLSHMERVAERLAALGVTPRVVRWAEAPEKGDAADFVAQGGTAEGVRALLGAAQPWEPPKAEDGAALLGELGTFIRRYVVVSAEQADAVALWVAHTHTIDAADSTPYLAVTSAEKRSGKTRLLETLELLVARPWLAGRVSASVLMRKADADAPTLLLDEGDAAFGEEKERREALRGLLDMGHRRGGVAYVSVRVGGDWVDRGFSAFCPKAIASIGQLPDTVADRAITVAVKRRAPSERVARFRRREAEALAAPLRERLERWAAAHLATLREARPEIPDALDDRAADGWEPLLAIADLAGEDWPQRARVAALALSTGDGRDDDSLGVRLLADIRAILEERDVERLPSAELVKALVAIEDAPWPDMRGRSLDTANLARLLKPFGVAPRKMRLGEKTFRGYERADFADAWQRYIPRGGGTDGTDGTDGAPELNLTGESVPRVPPVPPSTGCEDRPERCACGGELVAYTPAGRPVCQRHRQPDDACSACGSRDYWARKDGGWVCSRCHPVPSPDAVLEIVMVGSARRCGT